MSNRPPIPQMDNLFNLRDHGGLRTATGEAVRNGRLYRADGVHRASPDDVAKLQQLGIATVIDLRSTGEIGKYGRFEGETIGARFAHLPLLDRLWSKKSLEAHTDAAEYLTARYIELAHEQPHNIAAIFELVADPVHHGVVFHCSAGKDRTGVVSALLMSSIGVTDADIAYDYSMTAENMPALLEWIEARVDDPADSMANQPPQFLKCPPAAILGFLDHMRHEYGSIDQYLRSIGIAEKTVNSIRFELVAA